MAKKDDERPIIYVKKVIKKTDHGSHGGSWKIAYADFVTAMMAFFMLMWLVNVASEEQKKGIADYFALNFINTHSRNGGAGMMQGINVSNANNSNGKGTEPSPVEKPDSLNQEEADNGMPSQIPDPNNTETSSASKGGENTYDISRENSKADNLKSDSKKKESSNNTVSPAHQKESAEHKNNPNKKSAENKAPKSNLEKSKGLDEKIANQKKDKKEASNIQGQKLSNGETSTSGEQSYQGPSINSSNKTQNMQQGDQKPSNTSHNEIADVAQKENKDNNQNSGTKTKIGAQQEQSAQNNAQTSQTTQGQDVKQGQAPKPGEQVSTGKVDISGTQTTQGQDIKQGQAPKPGEQVSAGKVDVQGARTAQGQDVKQGQASKPGEQVSTGKVDVQGAQTTHGQNSKQGETLTEEEKKLLKQIQDSEHEKTILYSENRVSKNKDLKNIKQEKLEKLYKEENESLEKLAHELLSKVSKDPETKRMLPNLIVELTAEGLKIQIVDQYKKAMFEKGSSQISQHTKKLLRKIGEIIQDSTKKVVISGHTDATPYSGTEYTNWELSSDRANATRKQFVKFGVSAQRFESVIGREAADPLIPSDPYAPQNRRISITLLRDIPSS